MSTTSSTSSTTKKKKPDISVKLSVHGSASKPRKHKRSTIKKASSQPSYALQTNASKNSSSSRFWHCAVSSTSGMWVFGGYNGEKVLSTFDILDGSLMWRTVQPPSPLPTRHQHSGVFHDGKMYVFGGAIDNSAAASNSFFTISESGSHEEIKSNGTIPSPRKGHAVVKVDTMFFLFGGTDAEPMNDMHIYDISTNTWSVIEQQGAIPSARVFHSINHLKGKLYLYGGRDKGGSDLNDFYVFDIASKTWTSIPPKGSISPPGKHGHTLVPVDSDTHPELLLFGGDKSLTLEIYSYSINDQIWSIVVHDGDSGPQRKWHTAVEDDNRIYIYGGLSDKSSEIDILDISYGSFDDSVNISRQDWEATAMKRLPDILALRERLRNVIGVPSYATSTVVSKTEDKSKLSSKLVLQLILEYLNDQGYKKTVASIEKSTGINYIMQTQHENGLRVLLDFAERLTSGTPVFSHDLKNFKWPWDRESLDPEVKDIDHLPGFYQTTDLVLKMNDNIWDDTDSSLVRKDGELVSGNLNSLVQHLIQRSGKDFKKCFFWCHKNWAPSEVVFQKLVEMYDVPSDVLKNDAKRIKKSVIATIKQWLDDAPGDFENDNSLVDALQSFIELDLVRENKESQVTDLRNAYKKCQKFLEKRKEIPFTYSTENPPPEPSVPKNIFSPDLKLDEISELEIARQLTLHFHHLFFQINPSELASGAYKTPFAEEKCPNLLRAMKWHQRVRKWVQEELKNSDPKIRPKKFNRFALICDHLFQLRNFQALAAIIQELSNESKRPNPSDVYVWDPQLAKTSDGESLLESINTKMVPLLFGDQRLRYDGILDDCQKTEPCVPYLELMINEAISVCSNHKDFVEGSVINFNKSLQLFSVLKRLKGLQVVKYNLLPVHQILVFFDKLR
eukprot:TRINITY_DN7084_c0_g1_i1.p1 TRINITY_DN7084_c0_g1~~TRINITY_DN7084_c0_g1_i1.p1  ORF type:complete len:915 (+),score=242.30 TRINITY_DN7084_c0_g1_i1:47-2746(+)